MENYNMYLQLLQDFMGNSITDATQLQNMGALLFEDMWGGVYMSDQNTPRNKYCIINTDRSGGSGEHWVAVAGKYQYDSFGRQNILNRRGLIDTDNDAEQRHAEMNCGQRCLAWLLVFDSMGPDFAKTI